MVSTLYLPFKELYLLLFYTLNWYLSIDRLEPKITLEIRVILRKISMGG